MSSSIEAKAHHAVWSAGEYRSAFGHWHEKASVRNRPRRVAETELDAAVFFPPELVPVVGHQTVRDRGPATTRRLLLQRLFQYLHFTTELESVAVIPVTLAISRRAAGLDLPPGMCADAFAITTDEAWHAQFSEEFIRQLETATGVRRHLPQVPAFVNRLTAIKQRLGTDLAGLTDLAFAIVSETLISTILADLPHDTRLPPAVRDLVQDHALDEGRHHVYFRQLLKYLWPAMSTDQRQALGPWLPELISTFLAPDFEATAHSLIDAGLTPDEAVQVLAETHDELGVRREIARAGHTTATYFADAGALIDPATRDAFAAIGIQL